MSDTRITELQNIVQDINKRLNEIEQKHKELKEKFEKHGGHYYGGPEA